MKNKLEKNLCGTIMVWGINIHCITIVMCLCLMKIKWEIDRIITIQINKLINLKVFKEIMGIIIMVEVGFWGYLGVVLQRSKAKINQINNRNR